MKKSSKIFEPSRGGTGIKFKIAKIIFIKADRTKILKIKSLPPPLNFKIAKISKKTKAKIKLERGPATETIASPHFLFLKLAGL